MSMIKHRKKIISITFSLTYKSIKNLTEIVKLDIEQKKG